MATDPEPLVDVTRQNISQFTEYLGYLVVVGLQERGAITFVFDSEDFVRVVPTPPELLQRRDDVAQSEEDS